PTLTRLLPRPGADGLDSHRRKPIREERDEKIGALGWDNGSPRSSKSGRRNSKRLGIDAASGDQRLHRREALLGPIVTGATDDDPSKFVNRVVVLCPELAVQPGEHFRAAKNADQSRSKLEIGLGCPNRS